MLEKRRAAVEGEGYALHQSATRRFDFPEHLSVPSCVATCPCPSSLSSVWRFTRSSSRRRKSSVAAVRDSGPLPTRRSARCASDCRAHCPCSTSASSSSGRARRTRSAARCSPSRSSRGRTTSILIYRRDTRSRSTSGRSRQPGEWTTRVAARLEPSGSRGCTWKRMRGSRCTRVFLIRTAIHTSISIAAVCRSSRSSQSRICDRQPTRATSSADSARSSWPSA